MSGAPPSPSRNAAAWRRLVRRVAQITRRPHDAEDFLQAAFLRFEEYRARTVVEDPSAFLVRVAANLAVDEARREKVRRRDGRGLQHLRVVTENQPLQDEVLLLRKRLQRVEEGLAELNPRTREIFLLHRLEGMKYREIADRFGISVSAVEKQIAKAAYFLAEWTEGW
jgi:RNA polymerase sigma-70 factor (ECF subfamily)